MTDVDDLLRAIANRKEHIQDLEIELRELQLELQEKCPTPPPPELLPCPYCDYDDQTAGLWEQGYLVECLECDMRGPTAGTAHEAIECWNSLPRRQS